jgi:hypothetical protein
LSGLLSITTQLEPSSTVKAFYGLEAELVVLVERCGADGEGGITHEADVGDGVGLFDFRELRCVRIASSVVFLRSIA